MSSSDPNNRNKSLNSDPNILTQAGNSDQPNRIKMVPKYSFSSGKTSTEAEGQDKKIIYESQFVGEKKNYSTEYHSDQSLMNSGISVAETLLNGPNIPNEVSSFEWRNVSLTPLKGGKPVVAASYGAASKGEIVAIVGPKDSGKTTLIKLLA